MDLIPYDLTPQDQALAQRIRDRIEQRQAEDGLKLFAAVAVQEMTMQDWLILCP